MSSTGSISEDRGSDNEGHGADTCRENGKTMSDRRRKRGLHNGEETKTSEEEIDVTEEKSGLEGKRVRDSKIEI